MAMHAATLGALDDDTLKRLWSMRTEKAKGTMQDFIATVVQNSTFDDDPDRGLGEDLEPRVSQRAQRVGAVEHSGAGLTSRAQGRAARVAEVVQPADDAHQGARRVGPRNRNVTSRIESCPSISISTRARPMPKPPWGGTP